MKVLLDHDVPHALRSHFPPDCDVETAHYRGWADYSDDELLTAVEHEFSVLVTLDTSLVYQQNLLQREIGLILIDVHPITPDHLLEYMGEVEKVLSVAAEDYASFAIREDGTVPISPK